jgi:ATP-dependent Lon protease
MNPVFLFDELDKVSATSRGDEIINTLIHLTDPVQNDKYTDKYFQEIDLDLSKSIIIFTYNNEDYINPILKDRMITINVKGYTNKEKFKIAKDYLIDEIIPKYNIKKGDIIFDDDLIEYIVELTSTQENGVRTLKREINNIISWVNMMRYIKTDDNEIVFPYKVTKDYYNKYCKKNEHIDTTKVMSMYL